MDPDKELYERQIKIIDVQIDGLVYDPHHPTENKTQAIT